MKHLRIITVGMVALSLGVACLPFLLPEPAGHSKDYLTQAVISLAMSSFAVVAAILFLLGLKDFKSEFKKTYYLISAGLAVQALSLLVYPVAVYLGKLGTGLTTYGGDVSYLLGAILIFGGLSHFARLLEIAKILRNFFVAGAVMVGVSVSLWVLPHAPVQTPELSFDLAKGLISADAVLGLFSAFLVFSISKAVSELYSSPLAWLLVALVLTSAGDVCYFLAGHLAYADGTPNSGFASLAGVVYLASRVVYIVAGLRLIRMTLTEETKQAEALPIDVITAMAILASNPERVDKVLDEFRYITASLAPNQAPNPMQVKSLQTIYYKLEDYLVNREPLLQFTKESLRNKLEHKLGKITFV